MKWIFILLGVLLFLFLFCFAFAKAIHFSVFGKRQEGNPYLKYFTAEDFDNLKAEPISFLNGNGEKLRGFFYSQKDRKEFKALVLFVHGMGGGHLSYTTEINALTKQGYLVMSYDNTGTMASEGKALKGLGQSILDLQQALRFVKGNDFTKEMPIFLMGHSWGAYTVCRIMGQNPAVQGVVAFSPFENTPKLLCDQIRQQTKIPMPFLKPWFAFFEFRKFGKIATGNTSEQILKSDIPLLLLHGEADPVVPMQNAPIVNPKVQKQKNVTCISYPKKQHNVYASLEAESYIAESFAKLLKLVKEKKQDEANAFSKTLDFHKMCEEDETVMQTVFDFIEKNLK